MPRLRARRMAFRVLVAAFALWLPAATGQGGKATVIAAHSLAKSMNERPHLSCHGEGSKKDCCCKGKETLRAANCGCHDGEPVFGSSAHDPMLVAWVTGTMRPSVASRFSMPDIGVPDRSGDTPELPPPEANFLAA